MIRDLRVRGRRKLLFFDVLRLSMCKNAATRFIFILTMLSLLVVSPASSIVTKPSVPEFTLTYLDNSYDVQSTTTSTIDPYTGKVITSTVPGYHVKNTSLQIIITNQPFTSYKDENDSNINLYYDVRSKGHFEENWYNANPSLDSYYLFNSNSPTTIISKSINLSADSQIDYQVRALVGKFVRVYGTPVPGFGGVVPYHDVFIGVGEASDWSNTQTITIPASGSTSTPGSSSGTSTNPGQSGGSASGLDFFGVAVAALVVLAVVALLAVGAVLIRRKTR